MNALQVLNCAKDMLASWTVARKCRNAKQNQPPVHELVRWSPHPFGFLKCNVDAGFFEKIMWK